MASYLGGKAISSSCRRSLKTDSSLSNSRSWERTRKRCTRLKFCTCCSQQHTDKCQGRDHVKLLIFLFLSFEVRYFQEETDSTWPVVRYNHVHSGWGSIFPHQQYIHTLFINHVLSPSCTQLPAYTYTLHQYTHQTPTLHKTHKSLMKRAISGFMYTLIIPEINR